MKKIGILFFLLILPLKLFCQRKDQPATEKDTVRMLSCSSIKEALKHPGKVYKLELKDTISNLPTEIFKLKNLKILKVSGREFKGTTS